MARSVFYSFHYDNDITRVMSVRNRWVTQGGQMASEILDHADFEKIKRQGDSSVKRWINEQMDGTSVTIVLIGAETLKRPYVQYEICHSLQKGNAVIGVYIHRIRNLAGYTSVACPRHTIIGVYDNGASAYFDEVCDCIYDYVLDDGYHNLGHWVEKATSGK